jgi:hypothetical protein
MANEVIRWVPVEGRFKPQHALVCPPCASHEYLLPPTNLPLRDYLRGMGSLAFVRRAAAAGVLAEALPVRFFDHIGEVYARVERVIGADARAWPLKLTALVHEERPDRLPALLRHAGLEDQAQFVVGIVNGFGAVWKADGEAALRHYVRVHRLHLEPLLLFELAHEGAPTDQMWRAARLAGLERILHRWTARLH